LPALLWGYTARNQVAFLSSNGSPNNGPTPASGAAGHPLRPGWYCVHPT
jgi:hypothetical protein